MAALPARCGSGAGAWEEAGTEGPRVRKTLCLSTSGGARLDAATLGAAAAATPTPGPWCVTGSVPWRSPCWFPMASFTSLSNKVALKKVTSHKSRGVSWAVPAKGSGAIFPCVPALVVPGIPCSGTPTTSASDFRYNFLCAYLCFVSGSKFPFFK